MDAGNGKFNLMILCWGEGHGSAIHDHADSHCFMKMLKGELREIRYAWPNNNSNHIMDQNGSADITNLDDENANEYNGTELQELSRAIMETNSVHYINGNYSLKNRNYERNDIYILFIQQNHQFRYTRTTSC